MVGSARRLRFMLLALAAFLAVVAAVNWSANPYGAWRAAFFDPVHRPARITDTEVGERVVTAYRIRAERPTTLLIGSSRVLNGMPVEGDGKPNDFFNASLSGASITENAALVRLGMQNPRLRRVIWGVEFYAFEQRMVGFRHPETRRRLEGGGWDLWILRVTETLLSRQALRDSQAVFESALSRRAPARPAIPVPWPGEVIQQRLEDRRGQPSLERDNEAWRRVQLDNWISLYLRYRPSREPLTLYRSVVADVRGAGMEVIPFVPPLSRCELDAIEEAGAWDAFQRWKRDLLVAGPYWDFSGYGKLDRDDSFFLDVPHFTPAVGHVILRETLGLDCERCGDRARMVHDAADRVDPGTVDAYLARQEALRAARGEPANGCARIVRTILRGRGSAPPRP